MLKEGRIFCAENGRYYANQEAQNGADKDLSRCVWVLLDFIDQVEYHTVGEFPAAILCFANGELYEIVPIPQGKETMICQLLRQPQKDAGKRIVVVEDTAQIELLHIPQVAGFCTVAEDGTVSYYKKGGRALNPDVLLNRIRLEQRGLIDIHKSCTRWSIFCLCQIRCSLQNCRKRGTPQREKHGASAQYVLFRIQRAANLLLPPRQPKYRASACGQISTTCVCCSPRCCRIKKKRDGCKFFLLPLQAALVQSGPLPHFSDCVICVEHIYDHNLPIKAVRDYDNLELKAVIDVIATFCLTDDTGAVRFFPDDPVWIFVLYRDNGYAKNCFSAWLNAPKIS